MRFSTYRASGDSGADGATGTEAVGVWRGERLHPVPGVTRLTDLLGDDGSRLRAAAEAAAREPGLELGTGCILELSRVHGADAYPYLRPGDRVRLDGGPLGAIEAGITPGRPVIPLRPAAEQGQDHGRQQEAGR